MFDQGQRRKGSDTYYSPAWVTNKIPEVFSGCTFLDPCPGNRQIPGSVHGSINGLSYSWQDVADFSFVNPPFSDIRTWIDKAGLESNIGHNSVLFCKLDYRTSWFRKIEKLSLAYFPVKGYINFLKENGSPHTAATFQMCFAVFGQSQSLVNNVKEIYRDRLAL